MTSINFLLHNSAPTSSSRSFPSSAGFLGRLQLFTKGDAINQGLVPPGTYGIPESENKIVKLGSQIDILPLARRTKALDMNDKEAIIANYDATSDEFKDIAARSQEPESKCMYGTSFLVFERSTGRLLEFFCGSKSTRPIAGDIAVFLPLTQADIDRKKAAGADVSKMEPHGPRPCTLKVRLAKSKKGYLVACSRCSVLLRAVLESSDRTEAHRGGDQQVPDRQERRGRDGEGGAGQEGSCPMRCLLLIWCCWWDVRLASTAS